MTEKQQLPKSVDSEGAYLALDIGTHAVKACLIHGDGTLGEVFRCPISLNRLSSSCVEQDPNEILQALIKVIEQVVSLSTKAILGAGLAIQRSTVVAWDTQTGQAVSPALSWQDTRGQAFVGSLVYARLKIEQSSGLVLSPHYGASKLRWLQKTVASSHLCVSPLVSFLIFHLLEQPLVVCDESNAGRTQLWNIEQRRWDEQLCTLFEVSPSLLPNVSPVIHNYGRLKNALVCGKDIELRAVAGDQNAAFMGVVEPQSAAKLSAVVVNIGSGAFVLGFEKGHQKEGCSVLKPKGLLRSVAFSDDNACYSVLEGTVNGAGLALSWFANLPEVQSLGGEAWLLNKLHDWLTVDIKKEVYFYNSVGGVGSPYWQTETNAFFSPQGAHIEEKAVAIIESIVFLLAVNVRLIVKNNPSLDAIYVSGGLSQLNGLCQRLSNILQRKVVRAEQREVTLLGVARMASGFSIPVSQAVDRIFSPNQDNSLNARFKKYLNMMTKNNFTLVAHRGYAEKYPENSLIGLEAAILAGISAVEFDIQISSDGVPVVFHDYELQRLAHVEGNVSDLSFADLQHLTVHEPERFAEKFYPTSIPSLTSLVELLKKYSHVIVFPEIKEEIFNHLSREEALNSIWDVLRPIDKQCRIISYDLAVLRLVQCQSLCPVGWVLSEYSDAEYQQIKDAPVDIVISNKKRFPSKSQGLWAGPWEWFSYEITSKEMLEDCLEYGVKWIESGNPVALLDKSE